MIWFIVHLFQFLRVFKYTLFLNEYLLHLMLITCSILLNNIAIYYLFLLLKNQTKSRKVIEQVHTTHAHSYTHPYSYFMT